MPLLHVGLYYICVSHSEEELLDGPKETLIIINPIAHNLPSRQALIEAGAWLHQEGWATAWEETARPGDAITMAARAAQQRLPLIFVCGGDGTVNEAANGLAGSQTALATIRGGVSNIWAREVGIPKKPVKAVQACLQGERRRIDLGRAGDRYFLLMAGFGLDGLVTKKVSLRVKRYLGAAAYAFTAVWESLGYRGKLVTLIMDDEREVGELLMLVVGNSRNYAGLTHITREAKVDDGLLDVCAFFGRGSVEIVKHSLRVAVRRHQKANDVLYRKVRRLELMWDEPGLPLHLDGDYYPPSTKKVEVVPAVLDVMVPQGPKRPLFLQ